MQSKIKSFEDWLAETFTNGAESFDHSTLTLMSFTYEAAKAITLQHILNQVENKDE